jgi:cytochrome P450
MNARIQIQDFDDPAFDPFQADEVVFGDVEDPFTLLADLRRKGPVHPGNFYTVMGLAYGIGVPGAKEFVVVGYDHANQVLQDAAAFSNAGYKTSMLPIFGPTISTMDPPEHPAYRRIFQKAFLPQTVAAWSDGLVAPVIDELIGKFAHRGEADLVQEFTKLYPFEIIYRQLNLPEGHGRIFQRLSIAQNLMVSDMPHAQEAARKLGAYFTAMVRARRADPRDDLVSVLCSAEVDGARLPEAVAIAFLKQLILAAGDTTFRATSNLLTGLLQHPDQLAVVKSDRALIPAAIDEALRWEPPVAISTREATRDTRLAGIEIPKGSRVDVILVSANRDESRFERPQVFDTLRDKSTRHVAFAVGPHICLGQHLARLEMTRALHAVLDRLPNLRIDPAKPPPVIRGSNGRHSKHLFVKFG